MIKVLIVDDSQVARMTLREILCEDPEIQVVGTVSNGKEALRYFEIFETKPDVVTMDVIMPEMDGFEATRKIMETHPLPIVIITSSYKPEEVEKTFQAMEAGAVTILEKPGAISRQESRESFEKLRKTIKVMAGVKVVRRWPREKMEPVPPPTRPEIDTSADIRILVMGASTGGPVAFQQVLSMLPTDLPVPIMIIQHIGAEFIEGMIQWLQKTTGLPIHLAQNGQHMLPGHVYMAPDNLHMGVKKGEIIELSLSEPEEGLRPSVSYLFRSAAATYGKHAVGVLLTGMGRDGGQGLKVMKDAGAHTIAQDESTSMVFGMPAEAIKLGGAQYILPLRKIPGKILRILGAEYKEY
jgi:two-component system chemotaxis response regulator CheB